MKDFRESECDSSIESKNTFNVEILNIFNESTYFNLAVATKKSFREYFSPVLEVLRPFLVNNLPEDHLPLQVQTFG